MIVESGTDPGAALRGIGDCKIEGLPPNLPEGSKIDVTISYDPQARVHVSAKTRPAENLPRRRSCGRKISWPNSPATRLGPDSVILSDKIPVNPFKQAAEPSPKPAADLSDEKWTAFFQQQNADPVTLCNECGSPLDSGGKCPKCSVRTSATRPVPAKTAARPSRLRQNRSRLRRPPRRSRRSRHRLNPLKPRNAARTQAIPQPRPKSNRPASPQDEGGRRILEVCWRVSVRHVHPSVGQCFAVEFVLAGLGLAGAPRSAFCSGGFFGASFSQPEIAKPATVRVMAKIAVNLRMILFSFAKLVRGGDKPNGDPSTFHSFLTSIG